MSVKRTTPEMAAKLAAVRAARANLQDRHVIWILNGAFEHFVSEAEDMEAEIVRYRALPELPIFTRYGKDRGPDGRGATREAEVTDLVARLGQYYAILEFLQALKDAELVRSAEAFAEELFGTRAPAGQRRGAESR
jgi:hypothetical protein